MVEYLVIVYLTFMDGSVVKYNNGQWASAPTYDACQTEIDKETKDLVEMYKDYKGQDADHPKPSTFIQACVQK